MHDVTSLTSALRHHARNVRDTNALIYQYDLYSLAKLHTKNHENPCSFIKVMVKKMSGTFFYLDTVYNIGTNADEYDPQ